MEKQRPLVTIGTAVYNGENYLRESLDSALKQTYTNFELIISDDASTDSTPAICAEYVAKDKRIRYVRQSKNGGIHLNSKFVVDNAKGEYFIFLHHDDALKASFLEEAVEHTLIHPNCAVVTNDFEIIDQFGNVKRIERLENIRPEKDWLTRSKELFRCPMTHSAQLSIYGLLKTKAIQKAFRDYPVQPKMLMGAELYLISTLAAEGEVVALPLVLRRFRRHSESTYRKELAKSKPQWSLSGRFLFFLNRCKIRFNQAKILWKSDYPLWQKISIPIILHLEYFGSFLELLFVRIPRKIWSISVYFLKTK